MTSPAVEEAPVHEPRFHRAWLVVIASGLVFFVQSGVAGYLLGVFQPVWIQEFGWPQTWLSTAYAASSILPGLTGVIIGRWTDKYGPRRIIMVGVVLSGLGYILISGVHSFAFFVLAFAFSAVGRCGMSQIPASTAIARWFASRRATAMGLASTGISLAGVVLVPLAAWLIVDYGWRTAMVVIGVGMWILLLPVVWFAMVGKPSDVGQKPYGFGKVDTSRHGKPERSVPLGGAMKDRRFWLIAAGQMLGHFGSLSIGIHSQKALIDGGLSVQEAAAAISLMATCALISRFIYSGIGDYVPAAPMLALSNVFQAIGFIALANAAPGLPVYVFAVFVGISLGGNVALSAVILIDLFGVAGYGAILGAIQLPSSLMSSVGPLFAAAFYDTTGSYDIAFYIFAVTTVVGGVCYLLAASVPRDKEPTPEVAASPAS